MEDIYNLSVVACLAITKTMMIMSQEAQDKLEKKYPEFLICRTPVVLLI